MIQVNVPNQFLWTQVNSSVDGSPITSGVNFYYDAGTYRLGLGTILHRGNGLWRYQLTQAETDTDSFGYQFTHPSGIIVGGTVFTEFSEEVGGGIHYNSVYDSYPAK